MHGDHEAAPESPAYLDDQLLREFRGGDQEAFERLYIRHEPAAMRLATILAGPTGAPDLVSESFARILDLLREGRGPTSNFRAYLHTAIRNRHLDTFRAGRERPSSDLPWMLDSVEPPAEELVSGIDANGAVTALTSLPGDWQKVLWHLEVEGQKPAEVAGIMSMSSAAVSSLAYRARERLRQAYLTQLLASEVVYPTECQWTRDRLSQYVRNDLSTRATRKVDDHVAGCIACAGALLELDTMNKKMAAFIFPVVLVGGMAALDLASAPGAVPGPLATALEPPRGHVGSATPAASPPLSLLSRLSRLPQGVLAASVTAVAVVAIGGVVWAVTGDDDSLNAGARPDSHPIASPTSSPPGSTPPPSPDVQPPTPSATPPGSPQVVAVGDVEPVASEPAVSPPAAVRVKVRPTAPTAHVISTCDAYGTLDLPVAKGLTYALTQGDGQQGPWAVKATAKPGYVIPEGARSAFSGDLGDHYACPKISGLTKVSQGDPTNDPWDITVTPVVAGPSPQTVSVTYDFDSGVVVKSRSGAGWTCREPGGGEVGAGTEYYFPDPHTIFTCTLTYAGTPPPAITFAVTGSDPNFQIVEPTGTVTLASEGTAYDEAIIP